MRELLFITTDGIKPTEMEGIDETIGREFVTGQNVYVAMFDRFLETNLLLFGEQGARQFLINVGEAIDDVNADLSHRQAWAALLNQT